MKVLLINPNKVKPPVGPLGLITLIEPLQQKGYDVNLVDLCFSKKVSRDINSALREEPDYIGITIRNIDDGTFYSRKFFLKDIKKIVRKIKKRTNKEIILGGPGFSVAPKEILEYLELNYGISGPAEYKFPMVLKALEKGSGFSDIPGLFYNPSGKIKSNYLDPSTKLGFAKPSRNFLDNQTYLLLGGMSNIQTKRGCHSKCIFCVNPCIEGKTQIKNPVNVISELEEMIDLGIDYFHITDSTFNVPEDHAKEICRLIIKNGINKKLKWAAYVNPYPFSKELAKLMKEAGCDALTFGIDAVNDQLIKKWGKFFTKENIIKVSQLCHDYEIPFMHNLLLGGPGETINSIKESYHLMRKVNPTMVGVMYGMRVYPKTPLESIVRKEGLNLKNKNLYGRIKDNQNLLFPLFYVSKNVGPDIGNIAYELSENDERFLVAGFDRYPYDNRTLMEAYKKGFRGPFWKACQEVSK